MKATELFKKEEDMMQGRKIYKLQLNCKKIMISQECYTK